MERKYFNTSLGKLSYLEGDGERPLFFLHGFGGTGNTWMKLLPYMNKNIKPVFVDLLGHGHSDKPDIEYRIEDQAQAVMELIKSFNSDKISLVGNSYGGWIALKLSSKYLKPVNLFLIDSAGISPALSEEGTEKMNSVIDSILKVRNYKNRDALIKIMENNKNPDEKISDHELSLITSNTVIIWGSNDNVISPDYGRELNKKIRNSKLIFINGAGHTPFINSPEEVISIINSSMENNF